MMEWGVNFAAKKFNEIRTQCDIKALELEEATRCFTGFEGPE